MIRRAPLLSVVVLLILAGGVMASPAAQTSNDAVESTGPESCAPRRVVAAIATEVLVEQMMCLTAEGVESLASLHDQQLWLANVTAPDACTVLSWQTLGVRHWTGAPCQDDERFEPTESAPGCSYLNMTDEAKQDLCAGPEAQSSQAGCEDFLPERTCDSLEDLPQPCQNGECEDPCENGGCDIPDPCEFETPLPGTCGEPLPDPCENGGCDIPDPCEDEPHLPGTCGEPLPNPCPTLVGSAPGALIVVCGIPIPDPCPEGVDATQACGVILPDPNPFIDLILELVAFALDTASGCVNGALSEAGEAPAGPEDTLGCGAVVRLAMDTALLVEELAWEGVDLAEAVAVDCLSAFDSDSAPSDHPTANQIGCGQLLRDVMDQNPCKDVLDPQKLSADDPVVCGETVPVSTVEAVVEAAANCVGAESPVGDGSGSIDDEGIQETCDEARGPKTLEFTAPCNERDEDGDGVVVMELCQQSVTVDPSSGETVWGEPEPTTEGSLGDPDDSDASTPIPFIVFSTEIDPTCGGEYELGATVTSGGEDIISSLTGTIPCPLPFTTPAYPHAASAKGGGIADNDHDGIPGHVVLQQRTTTIHADGSTTHEEQETEAIPVDPDDNDEDNPLGDRSLRIDPAQDDEDGDGIGDDFQEEWENRLNQTLDWLQDFDGDGLSNVDEFRWDLIPICVPTQFENCQDWEQDRRTGSGGDDWLDGEEVAYWNDPSNDAHIASLSEDGVALLEPDRHHDVDGDGLPDTRDPDSDNDGILDGTEVKTYGTYPEFPDSDCDAHASQCTLSSQTTGFYDQDRDGAPGTGDGIDDEAEVDAWNALPGASWSGDADGDGIPNLMDGDSDDDHLQDGPEFLEGRGQVFPNNEDSDNDAVLDGLEALWNVDSDGDGWINAGDPDSDNDGMPDGYEVRYGFDPLDPADALFDADVDGLSNLQEYEYKIPGDWSVRLSGVYWGGTDPLDPDTDDDELLDGAEVLDEGTNPFHWDTDADGLPDAWEAQYKSMAGQVVVDPLASDALVDGDGDSLDVLWCRDDRGRDYHNLHEYQYAMPGGWDSRPQSWGGDGVHWGGTHPNNVNTDGDLLPDGYEICTGRTDPTQADVTENGDDDEDGLLTLEEVDALTDFMDWDSDGDGLCDGGNQAVNCTLVPGSGGDGEVRGWRIVVEGQTRLVTSNPVAVDSDNDLLGDLQERMLGTDPRNVDTDVDGLQDGLEDHDLDGVFEEGETDPLNPDTDGDGLTDGDEQWVYETDGLWADSDLDGVPDGDEVHVYGTDPSEEDSDGDFLTDGVELGIRDGGGDPSQTTDPLDPDTDNDGILDGDEVYLYGLNPRIADEDCDAILDGDDENPYVSNVPPGQVVPPEQRAACAGAASSSPSSSDTLLLQDLVSEISPTAPMASSDTVGDVGLIVFEEDGTVSILARPPASENRVSIIEAMVRLEGQARNTTGLTSTSALIRAELQPIEEQDADDTAVQYSHGIRVALPEGMVEATAADYVLTVMDENLNAAVYTGSASGFGMSEVHYSDDRNAGDESVSDDANSWDYVRAAMTGGADPDGDSAFSSSGGLDSGDLGESGLGVDPAPGTKAFRIVAPEQPALIGEMVDGVLSIKPFDGSIGHRFVFYNNTAVEVDPSEYGLFMEAGCCGGFWKGLKKVGQGTTNAMSAGLDFVSDAGTIINDAGEEVKVFTVGFYNDVKDPRTPEMFAARLVLDIVGIGDFIDIYEGAVNGDWLLIGLGVAGLALSVATFASFGAAAPLDAAVTGAKLSVRSARLAGLSDDAAQQAGKYIGRAAKDGVDAADNAKDVIRFADTVHTVGKNADSRTMRGLNALLKSDEAGEIAARSVKDNRAMLRMFGDYATQRGDEAAGQLFKKLKNSDNVDLDSAVRLWAKYDRHPQFKIGNVDVLRDLDTLADKNIVGLKGLIDSAAKQAPKQGKGHYFTMSQVAERVRDSVNTGESVVDLGKARDVILKLPGETASKSHKLFPDAVFKQADGSLVYREYKNYDDVLPLRKFIKNQMHKYAKQIETTPTHSVEFVVQNGAVRPSVFEEAAKACQRFGREAGCIKFVDRFGTPIG